MEVVGHCNQNKNDINPFSIQQLVVERQDLKPMPGQLRSISQLHSDASKLHYGRRRNGDVSSTLQGSLTDSVGPGDVHLIYKQRQ